VGAGAGLGILLMGGQYWLLRITAGGVWEHATDRGFEVETATVQDREFTGGLVGIPGQEVQVFPAHWQVALAPAVSRIIQVRRHGAINLGLYGQGALLALAAHVLLWTAAVWICGTPLTTGAGWLRASVIYTVLVTVAQVGWLPRLGREAAFAMDKWVYYQQFDADALRKSIQEADRLLEPAPLAPAQAAWVYARPTAAARLARMAAPRERAAAWQPGPILRYLSWAGGNLAARSGPMVSGHPARGILAPDT
jgi:hypothetical protein